MQIKDFPVDGLRDLERYFDEGRYEVEKVMIGERGDVCVRYQNAGLTRSSPVSKLKAVRTNLTGYSIEILDGKVLAERFISVGGTNKIYVAIIDLNARDYD